MSIPEHNRKLHDAVTSGDYSSVKAIVESKVLGPTDLTLVLTDAVIAGHTAIVEYLIQQGADMHYFDQLTPVLVTAVLRRNIQMFSLLLKHCKNINFEYKKGNIAHAAVKVRNLTVLQEVGKFHKKFLLFDKADEVNMRTPLHEAVVVISRGNAAPQSPEIKHNAESLFSNSSAFTEECPLDKEDIVTEMTPALQCVPLSRSQSTEPELVYFPLETEIIRFLLEKECNPNTRDRQLRTPLHDAAAAGKLEIILLLLRSGARLYPEDGRGSLPWTEAIHAGFESVASYLLKTEDLYHVFRDRRQNCNHAFAAIEKSVTCVQYLIKRGLDMSDPRLIDREGATPLIKAIRRAKPDVASLLARFSQSVINVKTTAEYTAVDYALEMWKSWDDLSWKRILSDMVKQGANLNMYVGVHQVHILMQREYLLNMWKLDWILLHSPDLNVKSKEGWYLFQVAIHHLSIHRPAHIGIKVLLKLLNHGMRVPRQYTCVQSHRNTGFESVSGKMPPILEALRGRHIVLAYLLHLIGCHSTKNEIDHWYHSEQSQFVRLNSKFGKELIEYLIKNESQPLRLHDLTRVAILNTLPPGDVTLHAEKLPLPVALKRRLEWKHEIDCKPKALHEYYRVIKQMLSHSEEQDDSSEWGSFVLEPEITFEY